MRKLLASVLAASMLAAMSTAAFAATDNDSMINDSSAGVCVSVTDKSPRKRNPGTGAANMVGDSAAVAVLSLVGVGAIAFKRVCK